MKLSGRQIIEIIRNHFYHGDASLGASDLFWLLLFPGILMIIFLFFYSRAGKDPNSKSDEFMSLKEDDYDLFDSIRLQKGLESFDRDFILSLCQEHKIEAVKVLLDKTLYEKLEASLSFYNLKNGIDSEKDINVSHLRKIKRKIFSSH